MRRILSIFVFVMLFVNHLQAQETVVLRGNYDSLTFIQFADSLYRFEQIRIFFDPEWVEELVVHQPSDVTTLEEVLKSSLDPFHITWYVDSSNRIFLTGTTPLQTDLPEKFYLARRETEQAMVEIEKSLSEIEKEEPAPVNGNGKLLVTIGNPARRSHTEKALLSGYITEAETGEPVIGAVIYVEDLQLGGITDATGYFVLSVSTGSHRITFQSMGKKDQSIDVVVNESGTMDIELVEEITQLRGVVVVADRGKNVTGMQMGVNKVNIEVIKQIPAMMGESDILKTALLLPGVQTVGEGASGFNVRGGSTDQNLILLDRAPVFNSSHFFGFFSAFNPDVVKDFKLYKSGIPAEFGGRISSVFDINTKSGNTKKFSGSGGISPVTAKLMLEGPIVKDKGSFVVAARGTYSDWLMHQFPTTELMNSKASFHDINLNLTQQINEKNAISLSAYTSQDKFKLRSDTVYRYNNYNGTLSWKHHFSDRFIGDASVIASNYSYDISSDGNPVNAYTIQYQILYLEGRADFIFFPNNDHIIKFGTSSVSYNLQPGNRLPLGDESLVEPLLLEREKAHELSFYMRV